MILSLHALASQDVRYERRLLKERQQEDYLFEGKDKFITSAYRKKLEEDKKWVEDQKQRCVFQWQVASRVRVPFCACIVHICMYV